MLPAFKLRCKKFMVVNEDRLALAMESIKKLVDISEVLEQEGTHTTGSHGMCNCVLHPENKPSLSYDSENGVYQCFSCGSRGSVISLIRDINKVNHNKELTFASTVDLILATYPIVSKTIGFTTVHIDEEKKYKLEWRDDDTLALEKYVPYAPSYKNVAILGNIAKIRAIANTKLKDSSEQEAEDSDFDLAVRLITACELGLPEEQILEIVRTGVMNESKGHTVAVEITQEIEEGLMELF